VQGSVLGIIEHVGFIASQPIEPGSNRYPDFIRNNICLAVGDYTAERQYRRRSRLSIPADDLLQGKDPALRDRLEEAHDMFSLIEDELPALLERVETRRRG